MGSERDILGAHLLQISKSELIELLFSMLNLALPEDICHGCPNGTAIDGYMTLKCIRKEGGGMRYQRLLPELWACPIDSFQLTNGQQILQERIESCILLSIFCGLSGIALDERQMWRCGKCGHSFMHCLDMQYATKFACFYCKQNYLDIQVL